MILIPHKNRLLPEISIAYLGLSVYNIPDSTQPELMGFIPG
jgi:hypothetical protein